MNFNSVEQNKKQPKNPTAYTSKPLCNSVTKWVADKKSEQSAQKQILTYRMEEGGRVIGTKDDHISGTEHAVSNYLNEEDCIDFCTLKQMFT